MGNCELQAAIHEHLNPLLEIEWYPVREEDIDCLVSKIKTE